MHGGQIRTSPATLPLRKATMYSSVLSSLKNGESRTWSGRRLKNSAHLISSTITASQALSARCELIGIWDERLSVPARYERDISSCSSFWIAARMDPWCIQRKTLSYWDECTTWNRCVEKSRHPYDARVVFRVFNQSKRLACSHLALELPDYVIWSDSEWLLF